MKMKKAVGISIVAVIAVIAVVLGLIYYNQKPTPPPVVAKVYAPPAVVAVKPVAEEAKVRKGDGIERVIQRQLIAAPANYGFSGDVKNKKAIKKWAGKRAHQIAVKAGFIDQKSKKQLLLTAKAIGSVAFSLDKISETNSTTKEIVAKEVVKISFVNSKSNIEKGFADVILPLTETYKLAKFSDLGDKTPKSLWYVSKSDTKAVKSS